jgi:uncharacterized membrane protein YdbT with pleckstrin-like domain
MRARTRYVRRVLQPGENIVYATKLHWIIYLRAILLLIVCVIVAGAGWYMADNQNLSLALWIAAIIFALLSLSSWLPALIRRITTEIALTDRRIIHKRGLIARYTIETNRRQVESVDVDQSVLGRLIGYGTIVIRGTGSNWEPLPHIDDPLAFRTQLTAG